VLLVGLLAGAAAISAVSTHAQSTSDEVITFTARLTQSGVPVHGTMRLTFEVHATDAGPLPPLWSEEHPSVAIRNGLLSVRLGELSPLGTTFAAGEDRFVAVRDTLSGLEVVVPRVKITAVPYALNAGGGGGVPIGTIVDWYRPTTATPLPVGWRICDGTAVVTSPWNGARVPDLRNQFVRGLSATNASGVPATYGGDFDPSSTAGVTDRGGRDFLSLQHQHNVPLPTHEHSMSLSFNVGAHRHRVTGTTSGAQQDPNYLQGSSYQGGFFFHWHNFEAQSDEAPAQNFDFNGSTGGQVNPASSGSDYALNAPEENKPPFFGLLKIIKVQ